MDHSPPWSSVPVLYRTGWRNAGFLPGISSFRHSCGNDLVPSRDPSRGKPSSIRPGRAGPLDHRPTCRHWISTGTEITRSRWCLPLKRVFDLGSSIPYTSQKLQTSPTVGKNVRRSNSPAARPITLEATLQRYTKPRVPAPGEAAAGAGRRPQADSRCQSQRHAALRDRDAGRAHHRHHRGAASESQLSRPEWRTRGGRSPAGGRPHQQRVAHP